MILLKSSVTDLSTIFTVPIQHQACNRQQYKKVIVYRKGTVYEVNLEVFPLDFKLNHCDLMLATIKSFHKGIIHGKEFNMP